MPEKQIGFTVMQYGRDPATEQEMVSDAETLFETLASRSLIPQGVFRVVPYRELFGEVKAECISRLADLALTCCPGLDLMISRQFVPGFACGDWNGETLSQTVEIAARKKGMYYELSKTKAEQICSDLIAIKTDLGITGLIEHPDVLLLPLLYRRLFGSGLHGISDAADIAKLFRYGSCALLCPPERYYPELLWHESLHRCFACDECYDEASKCQTCGLRDCIMQYDPLSCGGLTVPSLCPSQEEHIRVWTRQHFPTVT